MNRYFAIAAAFLIALGLVACSKPAPKSKAPPVMTAQQAAPRETLAPKVDTTAQTPARPNFTQEPPLMTFNGTPYLTINVRNFGSIKIRLDPKAAPHNVSNVCQLAKAGFYDGIIFHRIIKDFMIQTGDPTGTGAGGPAYRVPAEIKLKNIRGAVAMARQGDQVNPTKASSSCQFYIILKDQPGLDAAGYTVIGNVVEGLDVVDKIGGVPVKASPMGEMSSPVTPVVMDKVLVSEQ
jgi:cyclophilin family peptidyl-prolyl cis-trans isomerase